MVEGTKDIVDSPSSSHHNHQPPLPPPPPPTCNNPPALFKPHPPSNPPPSIPSYPINTHPRSPPGSPPHADDVKKRENDKAIVVHTEKFEDVDDQPDTDDDEDFLDMDFMSQAMPLNIIYL
ncbi:unnamed protein product [Lactuca virosa]|uniref:Uncharacterized protein n=1 Tax=Lactuca virosa TaxID=75947 RepID=A0AAU9M8S2_9ASTR|nr:unnamed protein product [Lactuca virosa]